MMLGILSAAGAPVGAQGPTSEGLVGEINACRAIAAPEARLACFDQASAALDAAVRARQVRVVDRKDVREVERSLFGFSIPKIRLFGERDDTKEEFTELNTTIAAVRPTANGRFELRLADGDAVWTTTEPMNLPLKPGAKIRIRKAAFGGYFLAIQGARTVRGMRLR